MSDEQPTRPDSHASASASDSFGLNGLTMALGIEPAEPGHDPLLGSDIGGVKIMRLIAEGGMGRVYEGKQDRPHRTVAVKVMRPGLTSPSVLKRFEYEAEVLGRLQHPGIAHVYSVGVHRVGNTSVPYFVMEYIADAKTLTKYAADLKLPTRQRLDLFRSVCDAVAHGHQKGVIHRDLKPSNILVDATGQPKVIDFGVARATDSDMALTTMQTDVGQLIGTLQYMSPEQFDANPNDIDIRSDVYALGVVLYELLAGKPPYDVKKKAIFEVARIVKEEDPTPLSSFNRALKGDVAVIAGKCLEKDRGRRYSSASELGADIERHLTGEPIAANPPGFIDGLMRLARKHRAAAAAMGGVLGVLVIALIGIGVFANRADEARRRAESSQQTAQQAQADAEERRKQAEQARVSADQQRKQAQAAEALARNEKEIATQRLYEANLHRMHQLVKERNFLMAKSLLAEMAVAFNRESLPFELRHFESLLGQAITVCEGHGQPVMAVAFSPDGSRLATGSRDHTARIWEANFGKQLLVLKGDSESIAFSTDGKKLAAAAATAAVVHVGPEGDKLAKAADTRARLWDVDTREQLSTLLVKGQRSLHQFALSNDGTRLATTATGDATVQILDTSTRNEVALLQGHSRKITSLLFNPSGDRVATGSEDKTVRIWETASGKQLAVLEGHRGGISSLAFSRDGAILATGSMDARLWDAATGKQLALFEGRGYFTSLLFSPNGQRLATVSGDNTARLWDTKTGELLAVLIGHGQPVKALAFSPDGKQLATSSADNTARLWDTATGRQLAILEGHSNPISALSFSPDGTKLATASWDNTARLWDTVAANQLTLLSTHGPNVTTLAFSPDGSRLATGAMDKSVRLWDVTTTKQLAVLEGHSQKITAISFSPDGRWLATGSDDRTAVVWNAATGKQLAVLEGHTSPLVQLSFSPDSTKLATAADTPSRLRDGKAADTTARIWDVATGQQLAVLEGHSAPVVEIAFSPDGTKLATAADTAARIWDTATGAQIATLRGEIHNYSIRRLLFSPDGTKLATASFHTARSWDVATGKQLAVLTGHTNSIIAISFSPDGQQLATASGDHTARVWDAATGRQLAVLEGHRQQVNALAFSPDGKRLATADNTVRLWDAATGRQLALLEGHSHLIDTLAFSPDGRRLATRSFETARLWGVANAEIYLARMGTAAIERRLTDRVTEWLRAGPDAAVTKLNEARETLSPDEYRVAGNMILSRCASSSPAASPK